MNQLKTQIMRILLIGTMILGTGLFAVTHGQNYEDARSFAFKGELDKAKNICLKILSDEYNSDAALLLGRIYAWDARYDSSRMVINEFLAKYPDNPEGLDVLADVELWSGNYENAIAYCDKALTNDSANVKFLLKKANIYQSNNQTEDAVKVLENLLKTNNQNAEVIQKLREYRVKLMKNEIRLQYIFDYFQDDFNRDPWSMISLQYSRKTKFGTIIPKINLADKFGTNGIQAEIDIWPKISKNNYGYLNYGFSSSAVFPENRFGAEWYHNFPKAFEGSLGLRILDFGVESTEIYTASFGKYFSNNWASFRGYMTPDTSGVSFSGAVQFRHYLGDPENYLNMKIGYGISPDDNRNLVNSELNSRLNLKTAMLRIEYNHIFKNIWIINVGGAISNEEILPGKSSNYFTLDLSISRLF